MDDQSQRIVVFDCAGRTEGHDGRNAKQAFPLAGVIAQTIAVPCSGKLQPEHLLKAFEAGADLVVVLTCPEGECRYLEGRRRIERRLDYVRGLLDEIGLGGKRLVLLDGGEDSAQADSLKALAGGLPASPLGKGGQGAR
jgi:coenzyme F420-reducing hydrogenase delta subunit